jgi:hypothetical protein
MPLLVTIDTGSRRDAELIAADLPGKPEAGSIRGYGVVRVRVRQKEDTNDLIAALAACVERHAVGWARIRYGDEERTFKARQGRST